MLCENLRRQLGYLLWRERAKQNKDIRWAAEKIGISLLSIDYMEHGKGHFNWKLYQKLLALYHKDVQISLKEEDPRV